MARDRGGPAVAQQMLIYPMLDDRPATPDPEVESFLTWTYDDNVTDRGALLGEEAGGDDASPYAAPARADDLTGLPDTYIDVGDLDVFRNEDIAFARRLGDAGVPTELHVYPGCPHALRRSPAKRPCRGGRSAIGYVACAVSNRRNNLLFRQQRVIVKRWPPQRYTAS